MQEHTGFQIHENEKLVEIAAGAAKLEGILGLPDGAKGIVLFAHGTGSGRLSPRNNYIARVLRDKGFGTLLMDLLMVDEAEDRDKSLDMDLLAHRVLIATDWLEQTSDAKNLRVGYFGSDTGAAAVLIAAARAGIEGAIPITGDPAPCAVVCRSGRTDLAGPYLPYIKAPTLLVAGGSDEEVIKLNEDAYQQLTCEKALTVIPGATHLFEEPGALEEVARLAAGWFEKHLNSCA
ncbi:MAG TPA: alpha/beta hydrolase [Blastocatellia bacterium]|nr:alpha/beta hydrolase [Blastocatellia bacterium]